MRFELFALPILAVLVDAAAIKPSSSSSKACTTCPVTIKDTSAAIASVYSQMSAQSPKQTKATATTTVIGTPIASSGVARMTTATSSTKLTSKSPTSTSSSSSKKLHRRDISSTSTVNINSACATQPNYGYTYVPSSGDSTKFLKDATLRSQYMTQNVPANYTWNFAGYYASQLQSGYLFSTDLSSYNVTACAAICTGTTACKGFNIYFERDPVLLPAAGCPNPAPQTNVRCAFYGQAVSEQYAINIGSWRSSFAVLITGNNGYSKQ